MKQQRRILLVSGSASIPSTTLCLVRAVGERLRNLGVDTLVWDLAEGSLPPVNGGGPTPTLERFRAAARSSHALVLATPLYHNSYSGLLKNALDHLTGSEVTRKPVGLISSSGGVRSAQAVDHLRIVVRALFGLALPRQVIACSSDFTRGDDAYRLASPEIETRIDVFVNELVWYVARLADAAPNPTPAERPEPAAVSGANGLPDQIARAIEYICENYGAPELSLGTAAHEACMSRYHFSRTFKLRTGTRFIDFVTNVRIEAAAALLVETDDSVSRICCQIGYRDLSHFERIFKRRYGICPSDYRRRAQHEAERRVERTRRELTGVEQG